VRYDETGLVLEKTHHFKKGVMICLTKLKNNENLVAIGVVSGHNYKIRLWNIRQWCKVATLKESMRMTTVHALKDGTLACGGKVEYHSGYWRSILRIWDVTERREILTSDPLHWRSSNGGVDRITELNNGLLALMVLQVVLLYNRWTNTWVSALMRDFPASDIVVNMHKRRNGDLVITTASMEPEQRRKAIVFNDHGEILHTQEIEDCNYLADLGDIIVVCKGSSIQTIDYPIK